MFSLACFKCFSHGYPTRLMGRWAALRGFYRLVLWLAERGLGMRGRVVVRAAHYRIGFETGAPAPALDIAREIALGRGWEPFESRVFASLLRPGMRVFDIGANAGHYTLLAALAVGAEGHVHAFEPIPAHHRDLLDNVAVNALRNVTAHNLALAETEGTLDIFPDINNLGAHSLARDNTTAPGGALRVPCRTLDGFARQAGGGPPVHLIKMDTQGAEGAILRGGRETLRQYRPALVMEFWPFGLKNCGDSARAVLDELENLDYRLREIDERKEELRDTSAAELLAAYPETVDYGFTNLLATVK